MIKKKLAVIGASLGIVAGALLNAIPAGATQPGNQNVHNRSDSESGFTVRYNCGDQGLNPNWTGGEGDIIPYCGSSAVNGTREPVYVWIGPGWCASRNIIDTSPNGGGYNWGYQNLAAGGNGAWFQLWQSWLGSGSYENIVKAWHGDGCPTTGAPWHQNNPPGVQSSQNANFGFGYEW